MQYGNKRLCEAFSRDLRNKRQSRARDLQKSHKKVRVADFCRGNMLDYYEMVEALKLEKLEVESYEEQVQCGDLVMQTEAQDTKIQEKDDRILGLLVNLYRCKLNNINPYDYWSVLFTASGISIPRLHKLSS